MKHDFRMFLFICSFTLFVSGCGNVKDQRAEKESLCQLQINAVKNVDQLKGKVSLSFNELPSLSMMNNTGYATDNEKVVIQELDTIATRCAYQLASTYPQDQITQAFVEKVIQSGRELRSMLYAGKINYGQYNTMLVELSTEANTAYAKLAEMQQQKQVINNSIMLQNYRLINQLTTPQAFR